MRFLKFNRSVVFSECRSCPRQAASQSHIPFGLLFSFQGTMKRSFTYSHWENSNSNPKRKNIFEFENPSHLFAQRVSKCTPVFWLSPEKLFEKFIPPPIPTGKSQMHPLNGKIFPNEKPLHLFGQRVPKCTPNFRLSPKNFLRKFIPSLVPTGRGHLGTSISKSKKQQELSSKAAEFLPVKR